MTSSAVNDRELDQRRGVSAALGRWREDVERYDPDCDSKLAEQRLRSIVATREFGVPIIDVFNEGTSYTLQIVTDDVPYLVESITAALAKLGAEPICVVHPEVNVVRRSDGQLIAATAHSTAGVLPDSRAESWLHLALPSSAAVIDADAIVMTARTVVDQIQIVERDGPDIKRELLELADQLSDERPADADLLRWLANSMLWPIAYCRGAADGYEGSLGLFRRDDWQPRDVIGPHAASDLAFSRTLATAHVRRESHPTLISIRGTAATVHYFVGLFTVSAIYENVMDIPVVDQRIRGAIELEGVDFESFSGQAILEVMQTLPRAELFASSSAELHRISSAALRAAMTRELRMIVRRDDGARAVTVLVYLPRDRYTTAVRQTMEQILVDEFDGDAIEFATRLGDTEIAVVYFTVFGAKDPATDYSELERSLSKAGRTWRDDLNVRAVSEPGVSPVVVQQFSEVFTEAYKQDFDAARAIADIGRLTALQDNDISVRLNSDDADSSLWQFGLYIAGSGVSLSTVLPVLHSLGVEVLDERPYSFMLEGRPPRWLYEFRLRVPRGLTQDVPLENLQKWFTEAFVAIWHADADADRFNELVLMTGLPWRAVSLLRAQARYLRQAGFPYSQTNIARVLAQHPRATQLLVQLFESRFDPDGTTQGRDESVDGELRAEIDEVVSLEVDRILRAMHGLVLATLRTNYFRTDGAAEPQHRVALAFKFDPRQIPQLPKPRPQFEIFVCSPRTEGVHLRFGRVARGGLRWSDRLEDYRTEILGLVKAQAVKNAVIVPVGAKGGFVVKRPPAATGDAGADRVALQAEAVECYRIFIASLLDVTDNVDRTSGTVLPPQSVVRRDGDDTYLVVAADKGTATFSDIANGVAQQYNFWLGDAFASGGSAGYDHKAMGITARGAWEAVKRHFLELGIDIQRDDFTVVGIGDMSGDVFGNGMLLSRHIRLVAAFDHRHIFIDPNPEAGRSFAERERLFRLPRSSWADYDPGLISAGGGVWERSLKSIAVTPEMRAALDLPETAVTVSPPELVKAILLSPNDLLWNGGIGTYVKSSSESHSDVGDKSNDAVRVDGDQLRVKVIGEGGNLGVTSLGRIEFSLAGGHINTDALDNSAGVDCSDHEVNIKVLIDRLVSTGSLASPNRNALLASMTADVAELVLDDNISQNYVMGTARAQAPQMVPVHQRVIADLETTRGLDRELEALPTDAEINRRRTLGAGLVSPELATLMAHVKLALKSDLLGSDVPELATFSDRLGAYFPELLRSIDPKAVRAHPLRREIITTQLVNEVVDIGGITYVFRLGEEVGARSTDAVRAFFAAAGIFDIPRLSAEIRASAAPVAVRNQLELRTRRTLDRVSRWLLTNRPQPIAVGAEINRYSELVRELSPLVLQWRGGRTAPSRDDALGVLEATSQAPSGAPTSVVSNVANLLDTFALLDIIDISEICDRSPREVGEVYFALNDHLHIDVLQSSVTALERGDRWHALARLALRDDLYSSLRALTADVLAGSDMGDSPSDKIADWESTNSSRLTRARAALAQIFATENLDLATLSVAVRQVRSMVSGVGAGVDGRR